MAFWLSYAKKLIAKAMAGGFTRPAEGARFSERCHVCGKAFPAEFLEDGTCISCRIAYEQQESERPGGNGSGSSQASRSTDNLGEAYRILGCKASDTDAQIKSRYRVLIKECHVDSLPKDLPDYLRDAANGRFREVHEAYQTIMKSRKG
jgi:hypothetical protein